MSILYSIPVLESAGKDDFAILKNAIIFVKTTAVFHAICNCNKVVSVKCRCCLKFYDKVADVQTFCNLLVRKL